MKPTLFRIRETQAYYTSIQEGLKSIVVKCTEIACELLNLSGL